MVTIDLRLHNFLSDNSYISFKRNDYVIESKNNNQKKSLKKQKHTWSPIKSPIPGKCAVEESDRKSVV